MAYVLPWLATAFGGTAAGGAAAGAGAAAAGGAAAGGVTAAGVAGAAATAAATVGAGVLASKALAPKAPSIAGMAPPSIDEAKQAQQTSDRLRTRRGVLANLYAPSGGSPNVGQKTLLGQ